MKNIINIIFILILGISCTNMNTVSADKMDSSQPVSKKQGHVSKEILVRFKPGTTAGTIKAIQDKAGLEIVRKLSVPDLYLMKVKGKTSEKEIIKELKKFTEVQYAEPNYKYRIDTE